MQRSQQQARESIAPTKMSKTVKQVILTVRPEFEMPLILSRGSMEEVEEILVVGAAVQQMMRTRRTTTEIQKITEQKDAELAKIQATYQQNVAQLEKNLAQLSEEREHAAMDHAARVRECQATEREVLSKEYEERMRNIRKDNEVLTARLEAAAARAAALEEARERDVAAAVGRMEEAMSHVIRGKQEELDRMRGAQDKLSTVIQRQSDEIQKLAQTWSRRSANAKTKGTDYEDEFGAKLRRAFGVCRGFTITDTRSLATGHAMDYSTTIDGNVVMWELKNYTNTVPKTEVDKFLRDVRENAHCSIAVMISRSTDIYGKSTAAIHPIFTEFEGERMLVYVSRFEDFCGDDDARVFSMMLGLFRVWWEYHRTESKTMDRAELVHELHRIVEDVGQRRTEWRRHRGHLEEITRWMSDILEEHESRMDRLLQRIQREDDVTTAAAATAAAAASATVIPEEVFRDSREERDVAWIRSILRVCVPAADQEIEVRELVELLSAHHKLSKDTIRSNVMSVIRDSAVYKRSVIKYVRGLTKKIPAAAAAISEEDGKES